MIDDRLSDKLAKSWRGSAVLSSHPREKIRPRCRSNPRKMQSQADLMPYKLSKITGQKQMISVILAGKNTVRRECQYSSPNWPAWFLSEADPNWQSTY